MKGSGFDESPIGIQIITAGIAACLADFATFPLDTAKVRLQVQGEGKLVSSGAKISPHYRGVFNTITTIAREEGPKSLYKGLSAGLQRQMCFASIRIGLYDTVRNFYQQIKNDKENSTGFLDVLTRICAGITTGVLAVVIAQPTDVVKIRFQAKRSQDRRYKSTVEAYKNIFKSEGLRGLWKGMYPNVFRNATVNVSEIVCYDLVKSSILRNNLLADSIFCHFTSGVIAGFFTTVVASPIDVIKTRYMNSTPGQYKSAINCAVQTFKMEGIRAFYKGFIPSFYRLVSWNVVMWTSYEKMKIVVLKLLDR